MEWASSVSGNKQEHRCTSHRYQVHREEDNEFEDLPEGEWGVDGTCCGFAKLLDWVFPVGIKYTGACNKICVAFIDEDGVEDIDKRFVDEECFEEKRDDCCTFTKD